MQAHFWLPSAILLLLNSQLTTLVVLCKDAFHSLPTSFVTYEANSPLHLDVQR